VKPDGLRVAVIAEDEGHACIAEALAGWELGPPVTGISGADAVIAHLLGTSGEQRRRGKVVVESVKAPVIAVTSLDARVDLERLLETGVRGVVLSARLHDTLAPTVLAAVSGQVCSPAETQGRAKPKALTRRERDVMTLVVMGLPNAEIARRLHVLETTVKSHVATSLRKLGVRTRAEATQLLLDPDERAGAGVVAMGAVEPLGVDLPLRDLP
jgi:DNA-binding NarL/FixJ family response regulator